MTDHSEWRVKYYEKRDGQCPTRDFLDSLTNEELARMDRQIGRLKRFGPELKRPAAGYLRDKIWELRARWHKVQLRILYWRDVQQFILGPGIKKKSRRVPDSEIDKAVAYREDYFAQNRED